MSIRPGLPSNRREPFRPSERWARPRLETLEERTLPAVTYHGGALLLHVEVQALYLGSDWYTNAGYNAQAGYFESFLNTLVNSSFMDTLTQAGYAVGRGHFDSGKVDLANPNPTVALDDNTIRLFLQQDIRSGKLQAPEGDRLYLVFVADNLVVREGSTTSRNSLLGYHAAFGGHDASGTYADIHYVVIPYHGSNGNLQLASLGTLASMTAVTAREIAEAVTDPNLNYRSAGWSDDSGGEIGEIRPNSIVYLNGYAVQRVVNLSDQPMTPAGAAPLNAASFLLQPNGLLWEHTAAGWTFLTSGIAGISDQAIDDQGRAMIDLVSVQGDAFEYHDGSGFVYLRSGVLDARAGQGVSYVLFDENDLWEYNDAAASWTNLAGGVYALDAGTNAAGVNSVVALTFDKHAYERTDGSDWVYLASGVQQISAGPQGLVGALSTDGKAYVFNETSGQWLYLTANVASLRLGVDAWGNPSASVIVYSGAWYELDSYRGWSLQAHGVLRLSKEHNGTYGVVGSGGVAYEHHLTDWAFLSDYVYAVA